MKIPTERLVVGGGALLVGLLVGWMVRGVATYNTSASAAAEYDDWRVTCPPASAKEATCELVSDILDATTQSPIARMTITTDIKAKKQVMGFVLPFGVALEPNMGLTIGKNPLKVLPFRTCNQVGCIVVADFDDKTAASFKEAGEARINFLMSDGRQVGAPVSFKGYDNGLSAYKSADAKRNNWFWRLWS